MWFLLLKVLLAPALVASGSLAHRRWGPAVGGRIIGLPLTALPLLFLLALAHGARFAAAAAVANQAGGVAQAGWVVAYALAARRCRPPAALAVATAVFAAGAVAAGALHPTLLEGTLLSAGAVAVGLAGWAGRAGPVAGTADIGDAGEQDAAGERLWVRMAVAAAFTLVIAEASGALGAGAAGLVGAFPLLTAILTVATHAGSGPLAAERFLHGVLAASWSVVASLLVLALTLAHLPVALAFALAVLAALAGQSVPAPRAHARRAAAGDPAARRPAGGVARHRAARHRAPRLPLGAGAACTRMVEAVSGSPARPWPGAGRRRGASARPRRDPARTSPARMAPAPR